MSEVVQCDMCSKTLNPDAPRRLMDPASMVAVEGLLGALRQHACSPLCLIQIALIWHSNQTQAGGKQVGE